MVFYQKSESAIINKEILSKGIDLRLGVNLKEIKSDENGKVRAVLLYQKLAKKLLVMLLG